MEPRREEKIDPRVYVGIVLFHWKMILLCFLYGLLGGVLYVQLVPKIYQARCVLLIYRDPNLQIVASGSPWESFASHSFLLTNDEIKNRAARKLAPKWTERMGRWGAGMIPDVQVGRGRSLPSSMEVTARGPNRGYCMDFLAALLGEHTNEWQSIQMEGTEGAGRVLQAELRRLEDKISQAEEELIEYLRLYDIARVDARGSIEGRYLMALMERHNQLTTEMMMMESQYPLLKGANVGIVSDVAALTRTTGAVKPVRLEPDDAEGKGEAPEEPDSRLPAALADKGAETQKRDSGRGWQDLRVKLSRLQQREKELAQNLKPEHPQLKALRKEMEDIQSQLDVAAQVELGNLQDRYKALHIQLKALEEAEEKWQSKNLLATRRRAELKRKSGVVDRYENNHSVLYGRYHDLRVSSELKAEHFRIVEPISASDTPVWPDPRKILLLALALGLGGGLGLVLVVEVFNNRIQSIKDVEGELGIPFLGGVPYWSRSNLERSIRPIVTEEHSAGAVEAYRSLRTNILAALEKINQKLVIITSADSREGKTLTALNLAIMVAEMGKKVLLLDMDLRRGRLHRSVDVEKEPGMADVLARKVSLKEVIRHTRHENLDIAPTGSKIENCAELLQSISLAELLAGAREQYDYIFMDTSPVLRVTDTAIIATQGIGAVVYVARINRTPKPLIRYSMDMLKDARIIGLIMNSIEMHTIGSLYYSYQYPNYAYYSYAYSYGYDYYNYSDEKGPLRRRRKYPPGWEDRVRRLKRWLRRTFLPME